MRFTLFCFSGCCCCCCCFGKLCHCIAFYIANHQEHTKWRTMPKRKRKSERRLTNANQQHKLCALFVVVGWHRYWWIDRSYTHILSLASLNRYKHGRERQRERHIEAAASATTIQKRKKKRTSKPIKTPSKNNQQWIHNTIFKTILYLHI